MFFSFLLSSTRIFLIGWTVSKHLLGAPMQVLCILSHSYHGMGPPRKPALQMVKQEASSKQKTNMLGGLVTAPPSHVMFLSVAFTEVIFYSPCFRKKNRSVSICLNNFISLGPCVLFWHVFCPYFQFPECQPESAVMRCSVIAVFTVLCAVCKINLFSF